MALTICSKRTTLPNLRGQIAKNNIKTLNPETISVPMLQSDFDAKVLVQVGDSVKVGQMIGLKEVANSYFAIYSPVSGEVTSVGKKMSARLKPCEYVVIKNDFNYDSILLEKTVTTESTKEEIVEFIKKIGLLESKDLAYKKYNTNTATLVASLVEDGPYLVSDVALAKANKEAFELGLALVKKVCGADKTFVVSSTSDPFDEEVVNAENKILLDCYPLNEKETIEENLGVKDTLVVEGSALVRLGLAATTALPVSNVYVTVAGDSITNPSLVSCPIGTSFGEMLAACGCVEGTHNLVVGNPLTGLVVTTADVTATQVVNEIGVFPFEKDVDYTCIRCGRCADVCPKGLIPMEIVKAAKLNDIDKLGKLDVLACSECGLCAYECPADIEVTETIRRAKRVYNIRRKK